MENHGEVNYVPTAKPLSAGIKEPPEVEIFLQCHESLLDPMCMSGKLIHAYIMYRN